MSYYQNKFQPRKPVRSFRDLEVYQKTVECAVIIAKNLEPKLKRLKYIFSDNLTACAMTIPLCVAESHSLRFSDFKLAVATLERAMLSCNKMIVYLEQAIGLYGAKLEVELAEDLMRRYIDVRGKMFRLEKSWQKYRANDSVAGAKVLDYPRY